jgi:hypothetical protein
MHMWNEHVASIEKRNQNEKVGHTEVDKTTDFKEITRNWVGLIWLKIRSTTGSSVKSVGLMNFGDIWDSHGGKYEDGLLLRRVVR